jgi:hypothetical protein
LPVCFQHNARELDRAPDSELRRSAEHLAASRNQLRAQHEVRKLTHHLDRNLTALGYAMKHCGGSRAHLSHRNNALFILDTVSEMGRFGAFGGLF